MSNFTIIVVILLGLFFIFQKKRSAKVADKNIQIGADFLSGNEHKEGVISTASGMQYEVLIEGAGKVHPTADSKVEVHYHGTLIDGTVFDSSVVRDKAISFALKRVIAGWVEGIPLMVEGDKFRFYIPSHLAYGKRAVRKIPAGALLIFDVELIAID